MEYKLSDLFYNCLTAKYESVGTDVNYAFVEQGKTLYIYFQCSNSVADWIINFWFPKKVYGLFKVHRGFLFAWQQVRSIVLDKVYSKDYEKVVIVGYSHGGGLTQLAHQEIVYHFPKLNVQSFVFESPRCLKVPKKLRYYWNGLTTTRVGTDLITHLPPRLFGFNDLGNMIKLEGDTSVVKNHLPKCIKYHYPQVVLNGLKKLETAENGGKLNI